VRMNPLRSGGEDAAYIAGVILLMDADDATAGPVPHDGQGAKGERTAGSDGGDGDGESGEERAAST